MALTPPEQVRSVDANEQDRFSSTLNRFTRIYTGGTDALLYSGDSFNITSPVLDGSGYVTEDSTGDMLVTFSSGLALKDDVLIHVTEENASVDFTDNSHYLDQTPGRLTTGWYYILLWYNYTREYEPPKAYYRILRESSLFETYQTNYLFLACAYIEVRTVNGLATENSIQFITEDEQPIVTENSSSGGIEYYMTRILYADPTNPTVGKRTYIDFSWAGW